MPRHRLPENARTSFTFNDLLCQEIVYPKRLIRYSHWAQFSVEVVRWMRRNSDALQSKDMLVEKSPKAFMRISAEQSNGSSSGLNVIRPAVRTGSGQDQRRRNTGPQSSARQPGTRSSRSGSDCSGSLLHKLVFRPSNGNSTSWEFSFLPIGPSVG